MKFSSGFALALAALVFSLPLSAQTSGGQLVRMHTNAGDIDVQLLPTSAPATVANFLSYMNRGAYNNSIFHRSVTNFIIQGGGFKQDFSAISQDPAVKNEYSLSNTRGTIAMAKLGNDPNSATNQWFFNLGDNSGNLDNQNGGFTVFGRVANPASLAVMDKIASLPTNNKDSGTFNQLPIFDSLANISGDNLVTVISVTQLNSVDAPMVQAVISASAFGGSTTTAPGSYIEIYGQNLAGSTRGWGAADFKNGNAPTQLDGVAVSVGGRNAYVNFVSPNQVNVQISPSLAAGSQPVIVTYNGQASDASSDASSINVKPLAGGLLAPLSFKVDGKQYVAAAHASGTLISNGKIPGVAAAPAQPGETIIFYGTGFGPVTPNSVVFAGAIAFSAARVNANVQFKIGGTVAQVPFAGLIAGLVGVYQFNVIVPTDAAPGDLTVEVMVNGDTLPQTLYLPGR